MYTYIITIIITIIIMILSYYITFNEGVLGGAVKCNII